MLTQKFVDKHKIIFYLQIKTINLVYDFKPHNLNIVYSINFGIEMYINKTKRLWKGLGKKKKIKL